MKKFSWFFYLSIIFLFSACELFNLLPADDSKLVTTLVTLKDNEKGNVYLTKLNTGKNIVNGNKTGWVSHTSPRSAEEDYYSTDYFMQELNRKAGLALCDSAARSAGGDRAVANGYSPRSFKDNDNFYSFTGETNKVGIQGFLDASLKYNGSHCLVYADNNNTIFNLSDNDYKNLGQLFDRCYEKEVEVLGSPCYEQYNSNFYVACNKKIIILVSDLYGDGEGQTTPSGTVGYFYQGDLFRDDFLYKKQKTHSNQCEIFYIDALFLEKRPGLAYSTLVHEFNHMINYVVKTLTKMNDYTYINSKFICDTWFTEMLSMTTEDMFQAFLGIEDKDSPKSRIPAFGAGYNYGFKNWDKLANNQETVDFIYANTYAFGAFLARNFGGVELISEIAKNDYINEKAITEALKKYNPDIKEIDFYYALRKFTLCVINTEQDPQNGKPYYSLNKSAGNASYNSLGFKKIDIRSTITVDNKTYNIPFIYKTGFDETGKIKYDQEIDIYPYGFSTHFVGTNITSFTLTTYSDNGLEYFYNVK